MGNRFNHPGIKRVLGGWEIRVTAKDPRTGKPKEVRVVRGCPWDEAVKLYWQIREDILRETTAEPKDVGTYADEWFLRHKPRIGSLLTQERYEAVIKLHIKQPLKLGDRTINLGDILLSKLRRSDVEDWLAGNAALEDDEGKPLFKASTINGWLRVLKTIIRSAVGDQVEVDVTAGVKALPTPAPEHPNSLTPPELQLFLAKAEELYPQWFPMIALGFAIGARPGELRPIRWDVDLHKDTGLLVLRRSQCRKYVGPTKTKKAREIHLPTAIIEILIEHRVRAMEQLANVALDHRRPGINTGLVFPSLKTGGYISPSCLDKPFADILRKARIPKHVTPKGMRRTFNDLARGADPLVIRSITGHSSEEMRNLYSTVQPDEKSAVVAKVIDLAGIRAAKK